MPLTHPCGPGRARVLAAQTGIVYVVGGLASYMAFVVVTAFYKGSLYKIVTLPLVMVSYVFFAVWPGPDEILYGWFFAFFGMKG